MRNRLTTKRSRWVRIEVQWTMDAQVGQVGRIDTTWPWWVWCHVGLWDEQVPGATWEQFIQSIDE